MSFYRLFSDVTWSLRLKNVITGQITNIKGSPTVKIQSVAVGLVTHNDKKVLIFVWGTYVPINLKTKKFTYVVH